jgi:large subunit ribosomal protein L3
MAEAAIRVTATGKKIRKSILGRKVGMTQIFDENGAWVPVTVLEVGPCFVLQVKTPERDGYASVQLGFGSTKKKPARPQEGLFKKAGVEPLKWVREVPFVDLKDVITPGAKEAPEEGAKEAPKEGATEAPKEGATGVKPGDKIGAGVFEGVMRVDVRGISKGRGFSGVIRRYHFSAGPKSHGTKNIREPGSTGMHTDPGRVLKGKRMPGHLGAVPRKVRNIRVVRLDPEANLILLEGSVPGRNGGFVYIEESLRQK